MSQPLLACALALLLASPSSAQTPSGGNAATQSSRQAHSGVYYAEVPRPQMGVPRRHRLYLFDDGTALLWTIHLQRSSDGVLDETCAGLVREGTYTSHAGGAGVTVSFARERMVLEFDRALMEESRRRSAAGESYDAGPHRATVTPAHAFGAATLTINRTRFAEEDKSYLRQQLRRCRL